MTIPFVRTVCACPADIENCSRPGYLIPDDLERIGRVLLQRSETNFLQFLEASRGAIVANSETGHRSRIGTIVPKIRHGRCVFLDGHQQCTIHDVAPYGCAFFDVHMDWSEWQRRSSWGLRSIAECAAYGIVRDTLARRDGGVRELAILHDGG